MTEKITKSLGISLPPQLKRSRDPRAILTALFSSWLPLSTAMLVSVIESLPSPPVAQATRLPSLIDASPGFDHVDPAVRDAMVNLKSAKGDPVVAYVSKMVSVPESELPQNKGRIGGMLSAEEAKELGRRKRIEIARALAAEGAAAEGATAEGSDGIPDSVDSVVNTFANTTIAETNGDEEKKADKEHLIGFARIFSGTLSVGDSV